MTPSGFHQGLSGKLILACCTAGVSVLFAPGASSASAAAPATGDGVATTQPTTNPANPTDWSQYSDGIHTLADGRMLIRGGTAAVWIHANRDGVSYGSVGRKPATRAQDELNLGVFQILFRNKAQAAEIGIDADLAAKLTNIYLRPDEGSPDFKHMLDLVKKYEAAEPRERAELEKTILKNVGHLGQQFDNANNQRQADLKDSLDERQTKSLELIGKDIMSGKDRG